MTEHHYSGDEEIIKRFMDQGTGQAKPEFPHGKLYDEDEGSLAFAIATDTKNGVIRIDFNKSVKWLGLQLESARKLKEILSEKIAELEIASPL
jgi:hypothetical protein